MGFILGIIFWMIFIVVMIPIFAYAPVPALLFLGGFVLFSVVIVVVSLVLGKEKTYNRGYVGVNTMGTQTIVKARVIYVFNGYGDLTLTESALIWNKSATSYLAFGVMATATDNHLMIPLEDIWRISTYTFIPGGGLLVVTKTGKEYKFSFKHKKDFKIVFEYLNEYLK